MRGAPVVEQSLTSVDAVEGEQMSVGVKFCSNPAPTLSWRHGDNIVAESEVIKFSVSREEEHCAVATISLEQVSSDDSGHYHLHLDNDHGHSQHTVSLSVSKTVFTREIIIAMVAATVLTPVLIIFILISFIRRHRSGVTDKVREVESCGTSTTSDNNKNEKLESDAEDTEIVFNDSYEKFETGDIVPSPRMTKPVYTDLCNYPRSSNGGSMRVSGVNKMLSSYNTDIVNHINTINFSAYNNQDNIYYWRQNFDNNIYS